MPRSRRQDEPSNSSAIPTLREARFSQSLERGLAILTVFTPERPVLGIADIADELEMSRSTTHRYVITLVALGYLEQGASRKYRLGLRVTDLGMSVLNATPLHEHAEHVLKELAQSRYGAGVAVLGDGTVVINAWRQPYGKPYPGRPVKAGSRQPAHSTAAGKVLLAHLPGDELDSFMEEAVLEKTGPKAVTSKRKLRAELESVSETGYALELEEHGEGILGMAVPVRDEGHGVVAAVILVAPTTALDLEALVDAVGPHVTAAADRLSARLGYRRQIAA